MKTHNFRVALLLAAGWLLAENGFGITDPGLQTQFTRSGQNVIVGWTGANTVPYQVQASSNLTSWTSISPVLTGTGLQLSFTNSLLAQSRQFFRVNRLFPAAPGSATFNPATGLLTIVCDALHTNINVANDGTGVIVINGGTATTANTVLIQILGSAGDDQITIGAGLAPAHIFGAEGNDTLFGGSGNDVLVGGPGRNTLAGRQGNDILYPDGDDTLIWNPGDGSDLIQGSGTTIRWS